MTNVGIVYNLHHGHAHLDRFRDLVAKMKPWLQVLDLNGSFTDGEARGLKIAPIGTDTAKSVTPNEANSRPIVVGDAPNR